MMKQTLLLLAVMTAGCGSALAAPFSYDYVEGGLGDTDGNGTVFAGISKSVDPHVYVLGHFYSVDLDQATVNYLEGGVGYQQALDNRTHLFINGQLLYASASDNYHNSDSDLGAIGRVGLQVDAAPRLELEGDIALSSNRLLVNDGLGLDVDARYEFTPRLSGAVGFSSDTELDGVFANVRYRLE